MRRFLSLLPLLLAVPAVAADIQQGTITAPSGQSKNNLTTSTPFPAPTGQVLIQCSDDTYVYVGSEATAAATSGVSLKIPKDFPYETSTTSTRKVIAVRGVSGSVDCKVFSVVAMAAARRFTPGGAGIVATGNYTGGTFTAATQDANGCAFTLADFSGSASICGGDGQGTAMWADPSVAGRWVMSSLTLAGTEAGGVSLRTAAGVLIGEIGGVISSPGCSGSLRGLTGWVLSGDLDRLCSCVSPDGGATFAWVRVSPGADPEPLGTATSCPI